MGDSKNLLIGEWAIAIGNPFGFVIDAPRPSVRVGVISAVDRTFTQVGGENRVYRGMIQTDPTINQGNSSGPLVNALGQLIGINTFIVSKTGGYQGLGFAIPINRGSAAAPAGLQPGNLITGVNGEEVGDTVDFSVATADVRVGDRVVLDVTRDTRATKVEFAIQEVPR